MNERATLSRWAKQVRASPEYAAEQAKLDFAVALDRRMKQLGVHRAELARRLGTSAAAVTMALRGDANLTLERMARLAHAVDATVHVHVAPKAASVKWLESRGATRRHTAATSPRTGVK
jgi:transcriptional regulator with XRE-family HTH domain